MHKVMNRSQHRRPGSRPPGRRDTRRPAAAPPRGPGTVPTPRTSVPEDGPPATTAPRPAGPTHPADTRPATMPTAASRRPVRGVSRRPVQGPGRTTGSFATDLFAERLLAVLSGRSPVHSMLRHTLGRAYDDLARLAERGPLRTHGARPVVRDIGWFEPRPGAMEVFARIGAGEQLRAMAFRLERGDDLRWRCTAVELGGPRPPHADEG
ncbi:Rv3235 family protein [Streptomyces sp. CRN 30]|uniref:Rv3235 family protein n=1 Tax=Streptomyces sp. CRN 30 TaxID=3075613 RepID=UPI002A80BE83|nr:Rv3235 family protein [Streptomyces sp. CRN 30]